MAEENIPPLIKIAMGGRAPSQNYFFFLSNPINNSLFFCPFDTAPYRG
jgi:hypothetical protein